MVDKVLNNLRKNRMEAYYVDKKEEVLPLVQKMLPKGATVSTGGSMTLKETGVIDLLRSGDYRYLDRSREGITPEEKYQCERDTFFADCFLCSCNAITEGGELVNVDGYANRIAAISFGPKSVIMVVGINKLVKDVEEGISRVKKIAAPLNTKRLSCDTYCNKEGVCMGLEGGMADGCASPQRICSSYLICGPQRQENRIKVILVGEELGY